MLQKNALFLPPQKITNKNNNNPTTINQSTFSLLLLGEPNCYSSSTHFSQITTFVIPLLDLCKYYSESERPPLTKLCQMLKNILGWQSIYRENIKRWTFMLSRKIERINGEVTLKFHLKVYGPITYGFIHRSGVFLSD